MSRSEDVPVAPDGARHARHRRLARSRRRSWVVRGVIAVVGLWIVGAVVVGVLGLVHAAHGLSDIQDAKDHLSASDVVSRTAGAPLERAEHEFNDASGLLHSPLLAPIDILPVLGRQLRSVQDLSSASSQIARIGVSAISQAHALLSAPHNSGPTRVAELHRLAALAQNTNHQLSRIDTGPAHDLLPPLSSKHDTFVRDLDTVRSRLEHAQGVALATAAILQGPQHYLLIMANNDEMRAGSGDFLELGVLSTENGHVSLSGVTPTVGIPVPAGKVDVTGDLEARWGWLKPGQDWRNLALTPQFDVNGPLAAKMWQAETGQQVDGVMVVDIEALHQFLEVTGPVTLADKTKVDAGNVVQLLAHDQYVGIVDNPVGANAVAEGKRQERLGSVAHAVLDALQSDSLDLRSLANAMTADSQGRHLLAWSSDPSAEQAWVESGVAGTIHSDSLLTAVINRGGNKLDQYLDVTSSLTLRTSGSRTDATLTVRLDNHAPPGQSQFIAGPYPGLGTVYGEYLGLLAVNLPGYATSVHIDGNPSLDALGAEGPTWVVATPVDVKRGASQQVVLHFTLPQAHGEMAVVPTARLAPVVWHFQGRTATDASPFTVTW